MADNTFNFDLDAPAVPTLTLDPVEAPAAEEKQPEPAAAPEAEQVKLSPEEQAMVDAFAQKIDITNSQQVLQYGSACQKKIGDFSETALSLFPYTTLFRSEERRVGKECKIGRAHV